MRLKFSHGKHNAKLSKLSTITNGVVYSFSISAGETCKFARDCRTLVRKTPHGLRLKQIGKFRCYAASMEVRYSHLWRRNRRNYQLLRNSLKNSINKCISLLYDSIPRQADIIRWHVSGDFFCYRYFVAFCRVVEQFPQISFYVHTKAIRYVKSYLNKTNLPSNLHISLSYGGKDDRLIPTLNMSSTQIVRDEAEAKRLGLKIDRNDTLAYIGSQKTALVLHGIQKSQLKHKG